MKKIIVILILTTCGISNSIAQDVIYKKDNTKIECKIIKLTDSEIEYTKKEQPNGPVRVTSLSKIHQVIYEDGTFEIFTQSTGHDEQVQSLVKDDSSIGLATKNDVLIKVTDGRDDPTVIGKKHNAVSVIPFKYKAKDKKNVVLPIVTDFMETNLRKEGFSNFQVPKDYTFNARLLHYFYKSKDKFTKVVIEQEIKMEYSLVHEKSGIVLFKEIIDSEFSGQAKEFRDLAKQGHSGLHFILTKNFTSLLNNVDFEDYFKD